MTDVQPMAGTVHIVRETRETMGSSGLIVTHPGAEKKRAAQESAVWGTVLAVASDVADSLSPGDRVLFPQHVITEPGIGPKASRQKAVRKYERGGKTVYILPVVEILGVSE